MFGSDFDMKKVQIDPKAAARAKVSKDGYRSPYDEANQPTKDKDVAGPVVRNPVCMLNLFYWC